MVASDEGLYYLALHSFVEGFIGTVRPETREPDAYGRQANFYDKLQALADDLESQGRLTPAARSVLGRLRGEHALTNKVRHDFVEVTREEAEAATHTFLSWCRLMGFDSSSLAHIEKGLELWRGKRNPVEREAETKRLRLALNSLRRDYREVEPKVAELGVLTTRFDELSTQLARKDAEIETLERQASARDQKADSFRREAGELRVEKRAIEGERDKLRTELTRFDDVRSHIEYMSRFTSYTRSRGDYERSVLELSPEQIDTAQRARNPGDFLITGPAGTGKTLVLLHALDADLAAADEELGINDDKPFALLTYTRTLVRFSHYLARIIGSHKTAPHIATVDSFLLAVLKEIREDAYVVYSSNLARDLNDVLAPYVAEDVTEDDLIHEIEDVILANDLTRDQYLAYRGAGEGTGTVSEGAFPSPDQRVKIWEAREACVAAMEESGGYSKSYASLQIATAIETDAALRERLTVRRIYVDESQDLSAGDLAALKKLSTEGIVMAGDRNQGIYRLGLSFRDAGIRVQGRSRILTRNYRNTNAICALSERFRAAYPIGPVDRSSEVSAVGDARREGPEPELYYGRDYDEAAATLVRRCSFFIKQIGYQPENIAVLAPSNEDLKALHPAFKSAGIQTRNLKSSSFDFETSLGVRLSTMHSAKGVEFPLVCLFLPRFKDRDDRTVEEEEQIRANLVYVAISRAMDNLQIVTVEKSGDPVIRNLIASVN